MKEIQIGEIIRQRRIELNLTQIELCEGICEPSTMSRIENGKQTPSRSKLDVFLQRLQLPGHKYYALMGDNELEIEQLKTEIISCSMRNDRETGLQKAEQLLHLIENDDDHLTRQFILRSRVWLGKKVNGSIVPYTFEEQIDLLFQALRTTIPDFDVNEIDRHWYSLDEMKIVNQIAISYAQHGELSTALLIYRQFLQHIQGRRFHMNNDNVVVAILVSYNYSCFLCRDKQYERAIQVANWGWNLSVQWGRSTSLGGLFYVLGEANYQLGQQEQGKSYFLQAYYSFLAMQDPANAETMRNNLQDYFPDLVLEPIPS